MKKFITLSISAVMVISMVGCSAQTAIQTDGPEFTEQPVVFTAECEIDNILADTESVTFDSVDDYEEIIRGLGFTEIDLDTHRTLRVDGTLGDPTATAKKLTYADGVFRLELSYYDKNTGESSDGWVLYGTKATEIADISGFDPEDCDFYDVFDFSDAFPEYKEYSAQYVDYTYYKGIESFAMSAAVFFPETGNLYNLVNSFEKFPENGLIKPSVIWRREQFED